MGSSVLFVVGTISSFSREACCSWALWHEPPSNWLLGSAWVKWIMFWSYRNPIEQHPSMHLDSRKSRAVCGHALYELISEVFFFKTNFNWLVEVRGAPTIVMWPCFKTSLIVEVGPVTLDRGVVTLYRALFSLRGRQIWVPSHSMQAKGVSQSGSQILRVYGPEGSTW